jgi:hypothetical protein
MSSGWRISIFFLLGMLLVSCGQKGKQAPAAKVSARPIEDLKGLHPRLIMTAELQKNLKSRLTSTHQWL